MLTWVEKSKNSARSLAEATELPTPKNENYKYTSLKDFSLDKFREVNRLCAGFAGEINLEDREVAVLPVEAASLPVSVSTDVPGVIVEDLRVAVSQYEGLLREKLGLDANLHEDIFAQLSAANWSAGTFVYVPKNTRVDGLIRTVQNFQAKNEAQRTIVLLDRGAECTLINEFLSGSDCETASALIDIYLHDNAVLKYWQVENFGKKTNFAIRHSASLQAGAQLETSGVYIGGRKGQSRYDVKLLQENANCSVVTAAFGGGSQHFDFWTDVHHATKRTHSQVDHYNVMGDRSSGVFNGTLKVAQEAVKSEAYQLNKNLLLSDRASVHSLPKLEILVDDIQCAHGSSTSTISKDQLFYFQTRGISRERAEELLIGAFASPVFDRFTSPSFHDRVQTAVYRKIFGKVRQDDV